MELTVDQDALLELMLSVFYEEFTPEKKLEIVKEIGDVMWYCATLARDLGYELDDVAQMNVDKLRSRMQRNHLTGSGDNR